MAKLETTVSLPELGLIAATRGMLGAGIGLLVAGYLDPGRRKAVAWTLVAVGAVTTIPLVFEVLGGRRIVEARKSARGQISPPEIAA
jgi:hypothetical protein